LRLAATTEEVCPMNRAIAIILVAAAFGSGVHHPASAQSTIGGPKKQTQLGGPAVQSSPVVPANKGGSISTVSTSHPKCYGPSCAAKGSK
jgi:hypothetical protein